MSYFTCNQCALMSRHQRQLKLANRIEFRNFMHPSSSYYYSRPLIWHQDYNTYLAVWDRHYAINYANNFRFGRNPFCADWVYLGNRKTLRRSIVPIGVSFSSLNHPFQIVLQTQQQHLRSTLKLTTLRPQNDGRGRFCACAWSNQSFLIRNHP